MCGLGVWSIGVVMSVGGQVMMGVWPGRGGVAARGVARSRWEVMVGGGGGCWGCGQVKMGVQPLMRVVGQWGFIMYGLTQSTNSILH